ncbi:DMT family transporter [Variovorax sp. J22P168]|uniref:DMT family transporter n=1 Tax=Variovorax jilinensis TaxID=3053513 RepID=UPI0025770226|nr:DMT family transporter [Variovorax sp. J22P168]MDM0014073.1 DMT family transporter [Variovorax sp. J22P168]
MPASRFSDRTVGIFAAVVTVVVWTAFIVVARASASRSLAPMDIAFARICGASLVLMPWGAWLVMRARAEGRDAPGSFFGLSPLGFRLTASAGVFGGLAYALLAYTGFFFAPASHASVLLPGSLPLWTTLLAAVVLHDRVTPLRALGLGLIVLGDLFVGGASLLHALDGGELWKGDLLFMGAAFCWACYSIIVRRHGLDAVRATIAITVFAFMTFVPTYAVLAAAGAVTSRLATAPPGEIAFQLLFQGIGSVVVSGIAFTRMVQYFGPVRTTMITALVPGLSALAAVIFLGEPLYWNLLAGLLLVTAGILFGVQRSRAMPAVAPAGVAVAGGRLDG